ncbi:DinB family protein [Neobacillus mesonae]|nr:DinB family protein [Neobacillus mesonae]
MKTISRMMEHLYWANQRLLSCLLESKITPSKEITKLLNHIAVAEQIWLSRLEGKKHSHLELWKETDITSAGALLSQNEQDFRQYVGTLQEKQLDDIINYENLSGVPYSDSIRDILTHVALHGQYHRGQLNRLIREQSAEPTSVDFIIFARTKEI